MANFTIPWSIVLVPRHLRPIHTIAYRLLRRAGHIRPRRYFRWVNADMGDAKLIWPREEIVNLAAVSRDYLEDSYYPREIAARDSRAGYWGKTFLAPELEMDGERRKLMREYYLRLRETPSAREAMRHFIGVFSRIERGINPESYIRELAGKQPLATKMQGAESLQEKILGLFRQKHVIAIGGDIGQGKSTLTAVLSKKLEEKIRLLAESLGEKTRRLVPEGEKLTSSSQSIVSFESFDVAYPTTRWVYAGIDREEIAARSTLLKLEKIKHSRWPIELVEKAQRRVERKLKRFHVLLADLPGKMDWVTRCLMALPTGAGIVSDTEEGFDKWGELFRGAGVPVLFEVRTTSKMLEGSEALAPQFGIDHSGIFRCYISPLQRTVRIPQEDGVRLDILCDDLLERLVPELGEF